jgi:cytochrome c
MDTMEINKVIASFLVAGIVLSLASLAARDLVHPEELKQSAIKVAGAPSEAGAGTARKEPPQIAPLLASANPAKGEADMQKLCSTCHEWTKGAQAKVGPPLYGVVGRERASVPGFDYSSALKSKKGKWTYQTLSEWLTKPADFAPGTRMAFAGIGNEQERADIIAYLRTQADNPEPLPKAEPAGGAPGKSAPAAASNSAPAAEGGDFAQLVATVGPEKGEAIMKKQCGLCHEWTKGAQAKVGPPLYGVVGRERASVPGFDYSDALKSKKGKWTYDTLNAWLTKPAAFGPGTKMMFPGLSSERERAEVVAYLRTQSDNPEPLPAKTQQPQQGGAQEAGAQPSGKAEAAAPAAAQGAVHPTPAEQSSGFQPPAGEPGTGQTQTEQQSGSTQPAQAPQGGAPGPSPAAESGPASGPGPTAGSP